jgi:hypothetical protein
MQDKIVVDIQWPACAFALDGCSNFWINCETWKRDEASTAWISEWAIEDFWLLPFSTRQMPHACRRAVALDMRSISVRFRENRDIHSTRLSLRLVHHAWCESITDST